MGFNPGDRVVYVGKNTAFIKQSGGLPGTVIEESTYPNWIRVRWDNGGVHGYPINSLEHLHYKMSGASEYEDILACQEIMEKLGV